MTANGAGAVRRGTMGEPEEIDAEGTLARQRLRLNPTYKLLPLSPQ
jgi:hypothetical protein